MKRSLYLIGAIVVVVLTFVVGFMVGENAAQPNEPPHPSYEFEQYCLLTWKNHSGDLCFALMLEYKSDRFIHKWNSKWGAKCGIAKLEEALAALPKDTYVGWNNWPPKFDYPPDNIIDEVIEFAKSKGVRIEVDPAIEH